MSLPTYATPKVADIVTFADYKEEDMLRLAACLEEHYPHSMANAVVEAAKERGLSHEEYHSQVQDIVAQVGVDEVYAEVLPEDKAAFIRAEKAAGRTVIMIGDGVNDSPALSEADAGIAISTGAAIAREIADITIASEDLFELVTLRRLSAALMARIHRNYRFIVSFNFSLIVLGVAGILPPTTSALLHNTSTLAISLKSMTNLLPAQEPEHQ